MNKKTFLARSIPIILAIFSVFLLSPPSVLAQLVTGKTTATAVRVDLEPATSINLGGAINATIIALNKDNLTATDSENLGATLRAVISSILGAVDAAPPSGTSDGDAVIPFAGVADAGQYAVNSAGGLNAVISRSTLGAIPMTAGIGGVNIAYTSTTGTDTLTFDLQAIVVSEGGGSLVQSVGAPISRNITVNPAPNTAKRLRIETFSTAGGDPNASLESAMDSNGEAGLAGMDTTAGDNSTTGGIDGLITANNSGSIVRVVPVDGNFTGNVTLTFTPISQGVLAAHLSASVGIGFDTGLVFADAAEGDRRLWNNDSTKDAAGASVSAVTVVGNMVNNVADIVLPASFNEAGWWFMKASAEVSPGKTIRSSAGIDTLAVMPKTTTSKFDVVLDRPRVGTRTLQSTPSADDASTRTGGQCCSYGTENDVARASTLILDEFGNLSDRGGASALNYELVIAGVSGFSSPVSGTIAIDNNAQRLVALGGSPATQGTATVKAQLVSPATGVTASDLKNLEVKLLSLAVGLRPAPPTNPNLTTFATGLTDILTLGTDNDPLAGIPAQAIFHLAVDGGTAISQANGIFTDNDVSYGNTLAGNDTTGTGLVGQTVTVQRFSSIGSLVEERTVSVGTATVSGVSVGGLTTVSFNRARTMQRSDYLIFSTPNFGSFRLAQASSDDSGDFLIQRNLSSTFVVRDNDGTDLNIATIPLSTYGVNKVLRLGPPNNRLLVTDTQGNSLPTSAAGTVSISSALGAGGLPATISIGSDATGSVSITYPPALQGQEDTLTLTFGPADSGSIAQQTIKLTPSAVAKLASIKFALASTNMPVNGETNARIVGLDADGKPVDTSGTTGTPIFITIPSGLAVFQSNRTTAISTSEAVGRALAPTDAANGERAIAIKATSQPGTFKLTVANAAGDIKADADVAVTAVSVTINITPQNPTIGIGQTVELTATVTGATDPSIQWASSDTTIATVSPTAGNKTTVTGKAAGTATITATETKTGIKATNVVTVSAQPPTTTTTVPVTTTIPEFTDIGTVAPVSFAGAAGPAKTPQSPDVGQTTTLTNGNIGLTADFKAGTQEVELFFSVVLPIPAPNEFFLFFGPDGKLTADTKSTSIGKGVINLNVTLPIFGSVLGIPSPLGIPLIPVKGLPKGEYKIILDLKSGGATVTKSTATFRIP